VVGTSDIAELPIVPENAGLSVVAWDSVCDTIDPVRLRLVLDHLLALARYASSVTDISELRFLPKME
jgi:hypothetical protein